MPASIAGVLTTWQKRAAAGHLEVSPSVAGELARGFHAAARRLEAHSPVAPGRGPPAGFAARTRRVARPGFKLSTLHTRRAGGEVRDGWPQPRHLSSVA